MKKALAIILALVMVLSLAACGSTATPAPTEEPKTETPAEQPAETVEEPKDYSGYTIRIYSNSNSTERTTWLINEAKDAGFTISIDDNSVISGDTAAIQAANENKDGDILFGLNETRWGHPDVAAAIHRPFSAPFRFQMGVHHSYIPRCQP